nr:hypothetical protein [Tanacetum cinerariifolium]
MTSFNYPLNTLYPIKECSSCEALYTTDYCCSEGIPGEKIICDLDKTPDLSQRSPQNCPKCRNPVDGHYCQGCALLRKKFKEDLFTSRVENGILQDYSKPSIDNTNVLMLFKSHSLSIKTPIKIPHKVLHKSTTIVVMVVVIRDEHLDTIPATESDEFIKSSVENLVLNPSEYEGDNECDVPACEVFTTFSNNLFDADYDFYSSDDQSFSHEDILKEIYPNPLFDEEIISMKIDPHHFNVESDLIESLLNNDSSITSSSLKIDSLLDEFAGKLTLLKSIPSGINETDFYLEEETHFIKRLLYDNSSPCPPKEFISKNSDITFESFSPFPIRVEDSDSLMEEIDLSFTPDDPMPLGIEEDDYNSERNILILEELLSNDSLSHPENESFNFDIPSSSRPPAKPPDGNIEIFNVKVMGDISEHNVPMLRHMITQPTIVPNQEKSPDFLSYLGHKAFQPFSECPMMIYGKNTPILDERLINPVENDNSDSSNDPLLEEVDLFLSNDSIPPELPDDNFDLEPEVISAVMEDIDEPDEHFNPGGEIFVSTNNEDVDYFPFMFVIQIFLPYLILPEISPLFLSTESKDTIFDPGIFD